MGKDLFYADIMSMNPEVTGSCNLVSVKFPNGATMRFIVDCGLFQEKKYEQLNKVLLFNPENVDFCLVTHNHVDHIGRLPFIVKNGYFNKIYLTEETCKLLPLALKDSYKVLSQNAKRKNEKCLYYETDVSKTISLLSSCKYNETIKINNNVKVTFLKNGHIIGSAMILIQISYPDYDDINLLFTGDYNNKNLFFNVPDVPEWILELPLTVIQESTYGYMDSTSIQKCFKKNVIECINNSGIVIAPVFSLGRAQEILYELKCMQENKILSTEIPIYLDGNLAIKYTEMFLKNDFNIKPNLKNFLPENLTYVNKQNRCEILKGTESKIILTTSGMGSYGPAQLYIPEYIRRKNALIHFTGFTAKGTLGDRLKNTEIGEMVNVRGLMVKKEARVEYTTEYSAHAKADEMIKFLKQFKNLKLILLNHGEENVKEIFASRILNEVKSKDVGLIGEYFFRVNPYGMVKSISSKFTIE